MARVAAPRASRASLCLLALLALAINGALGQDLAQVRAIGGLAADVTTGGRASGLPPRMQLAPQRATAAAIAPQAAPTSSSVLAHDAFQSERGAVEMLAAAIAR